MREPERLPHALLFAGPEGVGKRDFARALALRLLCERAQGAEQACGECQACRWALAHNHPDLNVVTPQSEQEQEQGEADATSEAPVLRAGVRKGKPSKQILIGQIRALNRLASVGSHQGGRRVVVIQPAETMNSATANALLKLLEEPPSSTLFILVSNAPSRLLPTILSRCQRLAFAAPEPELACAWLAAGGVTQAAAELAFSGGCPLLAKGIADSPLAAKSRAALLRGLAQGSALDALTLAAACEGFIKAGEGEEQAFGMAQLLDCVQKWLADLIRANAGLPVRYFVDEAKRLAQTGGPASGGALFDCYNYLLRLKPYVEHPLNARLFIEDLLIRYTRALAGPGVR